MNFCIDAQVSVGASAVLVYVDSQILSAESPDASQRQEVQMRRLID